MAEPVVRVLDFEGPLDLLIHLIEKNKMDIYDIPIVSITDQYIGYLHSLSELDLEQASQFLVMASLLLQIKSRMLLPKTDMDEEEEVGADEAGYFPPNPVPVEPSRDGSHSPLRIKGRETPLLFPSIRDGFSFRLRLSG